MLPQEYIVTEFENISQQNCVYRNYYSDKNFTLKSDWTYIICSKWSTGYQGCGLMNSFNDTIYPEVSHLPVLTYKQWKEMKESEIDFTAKGTKLPNVKGIKYRCIKWDENDPTDFLRGTSDDYYSFGSTVYNNEVWVLFDRKDYNGDSYFMAKLSDIDKLAIEQGMIKKTTDLNKTERNKIDCTVEGDFNLIKAFIADSGIKYLSKDHILKNNLNWWPYIVMGDKNKWETTEIKSKTHFILPKQYEEALAYIKKATETAKTFKLGKYEAIVKGSEISIKNKGVGTIKEFNEIMEVLTGVSAYSTTFTIGGYRPKMEEIVDNQEFSVGCVKNIPFKDMKAMYEYTKTL